MPRGITFHLKVFVYFRNLLSSFSTLLFTCLSEKLNSTDLPSKTSKMGPIIITVIVVVCVTTVMIFIAIVIYLRKSIETYNGFNNIVQESRRNFSFGGS